MKEQESNRGGQRPNAGRKAENGPTAYKGIRFPMDLIADVLKITKNFSAFVIEAVREKLKAHNKED